MEKVFKIHNQISQKEMLLYIEFSCYICESNVHHPLLAKYSTADVIRHFTFSFCLPSSPSVMDPTQNTMKRLETTWDL